MRWESKRPGEVRDYTHDWSAWLGVDTIQSSTVTAVGVTKDDDSNTGTTITAVLSGGNAGTVATITNTIVTTGGRTETEVFTLAILANDEPISLGEMKQHARVTDDSENELIEAYITAAREWVENYTGHVLVQRELIQFYDAWGDYLKLYSGPAQSVTEIVYTDLDGEEAEYEDGVLWTAGTPARVYAPSGATFPEIGANGTIAVTYLAGYAPGTVPQAMIQAIRHLVALWLDRRGAASADEMFEAAFSVKPLLSKYRGVVVA